MPENKKVIRFLGTQTEKDVELKNRLGLMLYRSSITEDNRQAFMDSLANLNEDIEKCYRMVRECETGSETEKRYLERIRVLEDSRFELLQKINGQNVERYNTLPLDVV